MASIERRSGRYRVKYRDPLGRQRSKTFTRKADADRFAVEMEADLARGQWLDPAGAQLSVDEWAETFLSLCRRLEHTSKATYERDLRGDLHWLDRPTIVSAAVRLVPSLSDPRPARWMQSTSAPKPGPEALPGWRVDAGTERRTERLGPLVPLRRQERPEVDTETLVRRIEPVLVVGLRPYPIHRILDVLARRRGSDQALVAQGPVKCRRGSLVDPVADSGCDELPEARWRDSHMERG